MVFARAGARSFGQEPEPGSSLGAGARVFARSRSQGFLPGAGARFFLPGAGAYFCFHWLRLQLLQYKFF